MTTAQPRRAGYSPKARTCRGMVVGGDAGVDAGTKHFRGLPRGLAKNPLSVLPCESPVFRPSVPAVLRRYSQAERAVWLTP